MATATETQQQETKRETATFVALQNPDLRIVITPEIWNRNNAGMIYEKLKGTAVWFGRETNNEPFHFKTDDPDLIAVLRAHKDNARNISDPDYESPPSSEPRFQELLPDRTEEELTAAVTAVSRAIAAQDLDALDRLQVDEEKGKQRKPVIEAIKAARSAIFDARNAEGSESGPHDEEPGLSPPSEPPAQT